MDGFSFSPGKIRQVVHLIFWWFKKTTILYFRAHFSLALAGLLAILGVYREIADHPDFTLFLSDLFLWRAKWHDYFITLLAGLTVFAFFWEWFGNKLATSPQEVRYIAGTNLLLRKLSDFQGKLVSLTTRADADNELRRFANEILTISSSTLCGNRDVDVGLMMYDKDNNTLGLSEFDSYQVPAKVKGFFTRKSPEKYLYPKELLIEVGKNPPHEVGPAEIVVTKWEYIAHLPNKKRRVGFVYRQDANENYRFHSFFEGWYPVEGRDNFHSILSVPITIDISANEVEFLGVLSFTTRKRDIFITRDYIMAESFAKFFSHAIAAYRRKYAELPDN